MLPGSPPRDLPNAGIEPGSPALQVDFLPAEQPGKPYINSMATTNQKHTIDLQKPKTRELSILQKKIIIKLQKEKQRE